MRSLLLIFALTLCLPAFADDVPPPPDDCSSGTVGDTGHEGPHCIPLACSADTDCKDGKVCQEFPLCIEEQMLTPGRSRTPHKYTFAYEACTLGGKCSNSAATCTAGKRCVAPKASAPKTTKAEPATKNRFGCAVSTPDASSQLVWVFLFFGGVLLQRAHSKRFRSRRLE